MINKIAEKLKAYSHIIYIDADVYASSSVTEEQFFSHDKPPFNQFDVGLLQYSFPKRIIRIDYERMTSDFGCN